MHELWCISMDIFQYHEYLWLKEVQIHGSWPTLPSSKQTDLNSQHNLL